MKGILESKISLDGKIPFRSLNAIQKLGGKMLFMSAFEAVDGIKKEKLHKRMCTSSRRSFKVEAYNLQDVVRLYCNTFPNFKSSKIF